MTRVCPFCGGDASVGHHMTGRDRDDRYLDPRLAPSTCHDDHELIHDDWRTLGVDDRLSKKEREQARAAGPSTLVERVEMRLRRAAVFFSRLAAQHPEWPWLAATAEALRRWADELARDIAARDQRDPGWRDEPGFYPAAA
jgi:hypothetical protein